MKILLVDDSITMRRIQKNQLQKCGFNDIVEADDGMAALEVLKANMPIDLILLDWNMPIMDGLTFLKTVRADVAYKKVKIIMCTSEAEKSRVIEAIQAGAQDYIVKPFGADAIQQKLLGPTGPDPVPA
jgi:two-component system chemotaxis response regulator CheY